MNIYLIVNNIEEKIKLDAIGNLPFVSEIIINDDKNIPIKVNDKIIFRVNEVENIEKSFHLTNISMDLNIYNKMFNHELTEKGYTEFLEIWDTVDRY